MNTSPKLQRAGPTFLLRLVAESGPERAAQILRELANEIEGLEQAAATGVTGVTGYPTATDSRDSTPS